MNLIKLISLACILLISTSLSGQFFVQTSIGIENPYNYKYTYNVTPNGPGPLPYESQNFRFFRTKIINVGIIHNRTLSILNKKIGLNGGINFGFMNQFVADTIANPAFDKLLFNAIHRNISFTPELGINFRLYKFISFTAGLEQFIPLRKWIDSEQGSEAFNQEYSEFFYSTKTYYSLGIQFDLKTVNIGLKLQGGTDVNHWATNWFINTLFIHHNPQRWILNLRYEL